VSARPRRRKFTKPEESHPDERWMASYMDMVTVLMCMFIVLYAMSTVDAKKFESLKNSLATGFGVVATDTVDTAKGVVVPPEHTNAEEEAFAGSLETQPPVVPAEKEDLQLAEQEVDKLAGLRDQMAASLAAENLSDAVKFQIDERGLTVRLVSSDTFFDPDDARLTGQSVKVLDTIAPVLAAVTLDISVEGHAALVPETIANPQYWEISTARATNVVRHLIEADHLAQERMAATGYGASRPLGATDSAEDLAMNRRVDIVVRSDQPDAVRELIPQVLEARQQ
jgi:chemotaxis protein MotB